MFLRAILFFMLFFISNLSAFEKIKIEDIQITGLQRVTEARLLSATSLREGQSYHAKKISQAIKDIFATGFFSDVRITPNGNIIQIEVDEMPVIENIEIKGSKLIKQEQIIKALDDNNIKKGEIFKHNQFDLIIKELEYLYTQQGRYGTKVDATTEELYGNRINININIREAKAAKIVKINIVGNKVFKDKELKKMLNLKERNKWNNNEANVKYSRPKITADLDIIQNYYLNKGYAKANIKDNVVSINSKKDLIGIYIYIDEGRQYKVRNIKILGETIVNPQKLYSLLTIKNDQVFSQQKVSKSAELIVLALESEGYGLANVNTIYDYNDATGKIDITFYVRPGQKTYIRKIDFLGNKKSTHTSLRRYLVQHEGAPYSSDKISESLARIRRLSYIESIDMERQSVPGEPDKVDLLFTIKEAPSGSIGGGLLYSDLSGVSLSFDYVDRNFYGSGNSLSSSLNFGNIQRELALAYTQPFLTVDGVSASYFLNFRSVNFEQASLGNYGLQSSRFGISFGYPTSSSDRLNYGFRITSITLGLGNSPNKEIISYSNRYQDQYNDFALTFGVLHNTLNRGFKPTRGNKLSLSWSLNFPINNDQDAENSRPAYYETEFQHENYFKLSQNIDELAIMLGFKAGYFNTWGQGNAYLPFYNNYFAGGVGSVRGYVPNSLGPRATLNEDANTPSLFSQGGNIRLLGRFEFIFPFGSLSNDASGIRSSLFWDIGNVFHNRCIIQEPHCEIPVSYEELRQSVGLSIRWYIQFFPLTFVLAKPTNPQAGDSTASFQFTLGSQF